MDSDDKSVIKSHSGEDEPDLSVTRIQESLPPEETSDLSTSPTQQKISEEKKDQKSNPSHSHSSPPQKQTKDILVIPTVSVPKVLCVPFSGSDEESPCSPTTNTEDQKQPLASEAAEKAKKATIIVPKQPKQSKTTKELTSKKPVTQSGVILFSNPQGNGGNGQKIKIDMSQSITPLLATSQIPEIVTVNKELPGEEKMEEIPLQCNEKIGDSPELEKKTLSKVPSHVIAESAPVEDLLQPLQAQEVLTMKPNPTFGVNEFGLYEMTTKHKPKDHVAASPRKDTSSAKRIQDDNILMCEGCGCYGMAGEFVAQNSCSPTCTRVIMEKLRDKQRKERDALKQKQKREAKIGKKNSLQESREMSVPKTTHYNESYPWQDANGFNWQKYLEWSSSKAAPVTFFKANPFPKPHQFTKGMKLEAIDPQTPSMICVVSVVEILGARLRLHFDGYSDTFDVWENVNSENLFPVGWCEKNKQCLVPPKGRKYLAMNMNEFYCLGFTPTNFCWSSYLSITKSEPASELLFSRFSHIKSESSTQGWQVGGKLEAADPDKPEMIHVATVTNIIEDRILVHFDGWPLNFDFWTVVDSPYLNPVGWCSSNNKVLTPPLGSKFSTTNFSWPVYLSTTTSSPVPSWAFRPAGTVKGKTEFSAGMRLEAVDLHNPSLVRVASVVATKARRVKVHYDGWPEEYDVWLSDQTGDIHPCGWAARTGHNLMSPLTPEEVTYWAERAGCATPGCRGLGHVKGARYTSHHTISTCPYARQNLDVQDNIPDRIQGGDLERLLENKTKTESQSESSEDKSVVPVVVGKTCRRRKKRKFFDEEPPVAAVNCKAERRDSADSKLSSERCDSRASSSTDSSKTVERSDQETQTEQVEETVKQTFLTEWEEAVRRTVFQPGYLPQPYPVGQLSLNWREHSKIILGHKINSSKLTGDKAMKWNISQVCDFIAEIPNIDHPTIIHKVSEEEIDGESLLSLTQADLTTLLEIKLGPAIKIYNAITAIKLKKK